MKNWQIMGILIFLIIGTVLISGCTSKTEASCTDQFQVCMSKCPIVIHTPYPTPAPVVDWRIEPTTAPTPTRDICSEKCGDDSIQCFSKY